MHNTLVPRLYEFEHAGLIVAKLQLQFVMYWNADEMDNPERTARLADIDTMMTTYQ